MRFLPHFCAKTLKKTQFYPKKRIKNSLFCHFWFPERCKMVQFVHHPFCHPEARRIYPHSPNYFDYPPLVY
jgi:hypothetical protein